MTERAKQLQQQGGPYAPFPSHTEPDDAFTVELSAILADGGGIDQLRHIKRLSVLLENESDLDKRLLLLRVLALSSELCKQKVLEGGGLRQLEIWVLQAVEEKQTSFLTGALQSLLTLPISVEALRNCSLGRSLRSVRKNHEDPQVRKVCDQLLGKWMKLVSGGSAASGKPSRLLFSRSAASPCMRQTVQVKASVGAFANC